MNDSIRIRPAGITDLPNIVALDQAASRDGGRVALIRDAIEFSTCWIAETDGKTAGYAIIKRDFFGHDLAELIYVDPAHRRRGIGTALVTFMERQCGTPKFFTSTNRSNLPMQRLLDRLGYRRSGIIENLDVDDPELIFMKPISPLRGGDRHQATSNPVNRETELAIVRRAYAKQIMAWASVSNPRIEAAFASVKREDFLGPGPWQVVRWPNRTEKDYVSTPDADPVYLYTNDLFGLIPERRVNNGQPSLHAALIAAADPREGEHVVHVGAGVGYYTAIMAYLVGGTGRATAIEIDPGLARRAEANLAAWPQVKVVHGDGTESVFAPADVIYVNAGVTRPADIWLDQLADGGRIVLPLSTNGSFKSMLSEEMSSGGVFLITRRGAEFEARMISRVRIIPCDGPRDETSKRALAAAFQNGGWDRVTRLYRHNDVPAEKCWLRGPGWCLAYE